MEKETEEKIKQLIKEKNYDEILKSCDEALQIDKKDSKAYFYKGRVNYDLEEYKEAIRNYDRALEIKSDFKESYNNRGLAKVKLGKYKEAIEDYNKAIELDSNYSRAYNDRGVSKYHLKLYEESIKDYDKAIKLNNKYIDAYNNRGNSKNQLKQYKEAIEDYDKAIDLNSNFEEAYYNRGNSKRQLKQYKEAIKDYDKVVELNRKYFDAYYCRAISKYNLEKYKEAIKDYDKVIKLAPNNSNSYNNRGISKIRLGKYKEAIKDYDEAIKLNPNNEKAYYNRYIPKYYLKQYDDAIEDFNKFVELAKKYININFVINAFINIMRISDIKRIFTKLIQSDYNDFWENDTIFKLLKNKMEINDISNKDNIFNNIKEILLYQYLLLKSLSFSNINDKNNNIEISYYTSLKILLSLLNDDKEEKNEKEEKENVDNEGKMRIVNISNANDPKEGKILESIFNKNGLDIKISNNEENLITLQTSYTRNKDSLTMFRLYGKNENREATGVCLVINKEYFNYKYSLSPVQITNNILEYNKNSGVENSDSENKEEQIDDFKRNLFWILYYNEKENILIYNPEDSKYENIIINLDNIEKLKNEYETKKYKTTLNDKKGIIEYIFSNIYYYAKELDKEIKNKELKNEIFSNLFENIKYLIKDEAFFEEQELRMLITTDYKNENIKEDKKRLYINYIKLFDENINYIDEIVLGSKIEEKELMADYIKKLYIININIMIK